MSLGSGPMNPTISTPYGFGTTADEVLAGVELSGRSALVTGGASGIGLETARSLARAGATVTLAVRDVAAGNRAAADIIATTNNDDVRVEELDLTDVQSISAFSRRWNIPLHMLILNAGIMAVPTLERNAQGHELQFATNYLGHFALTMNLYPWLERATGARVVSVSSNAHHFSPVVFGDIDYEQRPYDPWSAYGQSKTADVLLAVEITRRWSNAGICANALNPGAIATNLQRYTGQVLTPVEKRKTPEQGAATSVLLAASPLVASVGGRYFEDCNEAPVVSEPELFGGGVNPWALDPESAQRLWELSIPFIS
jgi:NAD(P)-dependent dehydrogenase (short-subunit alcohol dehydrogenase family)